MVNLVWSLKDGLCDIAALFVGDRVHRKAFFDSLFVFDIGLVCKLLFTGEDGERKGNEY